MILVVDDDPDERELVCGALIEAGQPALGVPNGQEALRHLERHGTPRLILLDLLMPEKDGWQTLWELRREPDLRTIPVIVMTAVPNPAGALNGARVSGFLVKPFERDDLYRAVDVALTGRDGYGRARSR